MTGSIFPQWIDRTRPLVAGLLVVTPVYFVGVLYYGFSPQTTDVGYSPRQPVPFSHALHAGELGMDCRYCHNTVEKAAFAAVPPTATCMNCHQLIAADSDKLLPVRQSAADGKPIAWVRVHHLPDYAYFDHSVHVSKGVGCVSCHGPIDTMEQVYQAKTLSMGWCLDCHRDPGPNLRPPGKITAMGWVPTEDPALLKNRLMTQYNVPEEVSTDCSTCH
jgi:hypothetical protein